MNPAVLVLFLPFAVDVKKAVPQHIHQRYMQTWTGFPRGRGRGGRGGYGGKITSGGCGYGILSLNPSLIGRRKFGNFCHYTLHCADVVSKLQQRVCILLGSHDGFIKIA